MAERRATSGGMSRIDATMLATWRAASLQFREAAAAAPNGELKQALARRAFRLAQQAEALARTDRKGNDG
jgi:hypothetical protein